MPSLFSYLTNMKYLTHFLKYPADARFVTAYYRRMKKLSNLLPISVEEIAKSLEQAEEIRKSIQIQVRGMDKPHGAMVSPLEGPIIYTIVRALMPSQVVETGVANGSSSRFLLTALRLNGMGALHSIDMPSQTLSVKGVGWLVPEELQTNWELVQGDSREELPRILERVGQVDMFLHDSLHTLEHVLFEIKTVQEYMTGHGVVVIDDIEPSWRSDLMQCFGPRASELFYDLFVMVR